MINIYKRNFNFKFFIYFLATLFLFIIGIFMTTNSNEDRLNISAEATSVHYWAVSCYIYDPDAVTTGYYSPAEERMINVAINFSGSTHDDIEFGKLTLDGYFSYTKEVSLNRWTWGTSRGNYNFEIVLSSCKEGYTYEKEYPSLANDITNNLSSLTGTTEIKASSTTAYNKNFHLALYFDPISYNIEYNLDGGSLGENAPESARFDDTVEISYPTKTGNRFTGWTISNFSDTALTGLRLLGVLTWHAYDGDLTTRTYFTNLQTTDGETVTFTANWEPYTLNYTYNYNGGSGSNSGGSAEYGDTITLPTPNARNGYTFKGWLKSGTSTIYQAGDSYNVNGDISSSDASIAFVALWETNQLIATLYYQDDKTANTTTSSYYSSSSTKLGLPELSRTGYEFKGWSLTPNNTGVYYDADSNWNTITVWDNNSSSNKCVATANAGQISFNLYAIWEVNEYSVNVNIYNPNGVEEYTTNINGTFTLRDDEGNVITGLYNEPSDHYITFGKSWQVYDIVAGTGRKLRTTNPVTCGSGLTMSENNGVYTFTCTGTSGHTINIYMEYITYTIAFNSNGGSGNMLNQSFTYDSEQALSTNTFKWAGYVFTGWNTEKKGSGKSYSDKETVKNLTSVDGATVTLYAQWKDTWANHASSSLETTEINGVTYNVIASAEDLAYLSKQSISSTLLGKYIQTADIDLSDYTWLPIGSENAFCGEYLGQGHKITGLKTCDAVDADDVYLQTYGGLFGKLGKNSTNGASANIVGVFITDCLVYGQYSGAIAGLSDDESVNIDSVNIEACILENIEIYGNTTASFVGSSSDGQIKDCLLISSNISTANTTTRGFYTGTMTVKSCYFVENNSAIRFTGESSDYSNWIEDVFMYPLPSIIVWFPNN